MATLCDLVFEKMVRYWMVRYRPATLGGIGQIEAGQVRAVQIQDWMVRATFRAWVAAWGSALLPWPACRRPQALRAGGGP
jgi:hypothetical protein